MNEPQMHTSCPLHLLHSILVEVLIATTPSASIRACNLLSCFSLETNPCSPLLRGAEGCERPITFWSSKLPLAELLESEAAEWPREDQEKGIKFVRVWRESRTELGEDVVMTKGMEALEVGGDGGIIGKLRVGWDWVGRWIVKIRLCEKSMLFICAGEFIWLEASPLNKVTAAASSSEELWKEWVLAFLGGTEKKKEGNY